MSATLKDEKQTKEKEIKEIKETTTTVEKPTEKASISIERIDMKSYACGTIEHIHIKDTTSAEALETYRKLKELEQKR